MARRHESTKFVAEINKKPKFSDTDKSELFFATCSDPNMPLACIKVLLQNGYYRKFLVGEICAYFDGRADVVDLLVRHDATLLKFVEEESKETLLHIAARNNNKEVVQVLLRCEGLNVSAVNKENKRADHLTTSEEIRNMIRGHLNSLKRNK